MMGPMCGSKTSSERFRLTSYTACIFFTIACISENTNAANDRDRSLELACKFDLILGDRLYKRKDLLGYPTQVFAARFDFDDNLFFIYDNLYEKEGFNENGEELVDIRVGILMNAKRVEGTPEILVIEPEASPNSIEIDKIGRVLVATDQGLYIYDAATNKIVPYMLIGVNVVDFSIDSENNIFIVDEKKAVNKVIAGKLKPFNNRTTEYNLYVDYDYNILTDDSWDTYSGNVNEEKLRKVNALQDTNAYTDIYTDAENNVYAVNECGLFFSRNRKELTHVGGVLNYASSVTMDSKWNIVIGEESALVQLRYIGRKNILQEECGRFYRVSHIPLSISMNLSQCHR